MIKMLPLEIFEYTKLSAYAVAPYKLTEASPAHILSAAIATPVTIPPGATQILPTGVAILMECDSGYVGQVSCYPATLDAVAILNTAEGYLIPDFDKELEIRIKNTGTAAICINPMEPIAQLLFNLVLIPELQFVEDDVYSEDD